jgi:hypothetical protein
MVGDGVPSVVNPNEEQQQRRRSDDEKGQARVGVSRAGRSGYPNAPSLRTAYCIAPVMNSRFQRA